MGEPNLHQLHIPLRFDPHVMEKIQHQQMLDARHDSRKSKRYSLEISKRVVLEFQRADGRVTADAIIRDMSEDGLGIWVGSFIHAKTLCCVMLMSEHGPELEVQGEVKWCRHFAHAVHEVGIHITKTNANMLKETLVEPSKKLASDLADIRSMVQLILSEMAPHLLVGLTPEHTRRVYEQLQEALGEMPKLRGELPMDSDRQAAG